MCVCLSVRDHVGLERPCGRDLGAYVCSLSVCGSVCLGVHVGS